MRTTPAPVPDGSPLSPHRAPSARQGALAPDVSGDRARAIARDHFSRSIAATTKFFETEAGKIADCCRQMAARFADGACLFVMGEGAQASDAQHVAVEFVHPIIVGKRALPAIALTSDIGIYTASGRTTTDGFAGPLRVLGRPGDIALGLCAGAIEPSIQAAMAAARAHGMLTVLVTGPGATPEPVAEIELQVGESDPLLVQEVEETLYHVLWELVHVFFESTSSRELYPFLSAPSSDADEARRLIEEVQASTLQKSRDICALRARMDIDCGERLAEAGVAMATRFRAGGTLLTFGNGGSATDAQDAAVDCMAPPLDTWRAVPALALTNDVGVVTAVGNDVGFDHVFARQVVAFGTPGDIALGFSTSGASRNVIAALTEAKSRGLLTMALSGGDGGALARAPEVDFCFTASSDHLPRIQEAHATAWHALIAVAQGALRLS